MSTIASLRGDEPWAAYDEAAYDELTAADAQVRSCERAPKSRAGVLGATGRERSNA